MGRPPSAICQHVVLGRVDIRLKRIDCRAIMPDFTPPIPLFTPPILLSTPSFPPSTLVIPAKAGIQTAANPAGTPANELRQHALVRVEISLKRTIAAPSFPISNPVIPAKAGIQTASAKPATRNQARIASDKSLLSLDGLTGVGFDFRRFGEGRSVWGDMGLANQAHYSKSGANSERQIPSPLMGEG